MPLEITDALEEEGLSNGSVCHWVLVSKAQNSTFLGTLCRAPWSGKLRSLADRHWFSGLA